MSSPRPRPHTLTIRCLFSHVSFFFKFYFIFKLYIIVLVLPNIPCLFCLLHLSPSSRFLCFESTTPFQALSFTSFLSHQNSLSFRKAVLSVWTIFRLIPKKRLERWSSPLSTRLSLSTFVLCSFSLLKSSSRERIRKDHRWCLWSGRKDPNPSKGPMAVGAGE